jgi:peptidoglycan/LPS O-acetylase OafA/YrhL
MQLPLEQLGLPNTGAKGYVAPLDGWRGLAIISVLLHHFFHVDFFAAGAFGVNVFFVLSGTLMGHILFIKKCDLKTFYQRRLSRVFPVFWLYVILIYGFDILFVGSTESTNVLSTLLFLRTYVDSSIWATSLPIGHLWSLNIEEHAYVIMSVIALFALKARVAGIVLILLGIASIVLRYYYVIIDIHYASALQRTEVNLSFIFIAAGYALIKETISPHVKPWMPIVALLLGWATYLNAAPWFAYFIFSPFLLAFAVNHIAQSSVWVVRILSSTPLRLVGLWSFSLYIWQQPLYHWVKNNNYETAYSIIGLFVAFAVALVSFYLFEQPIRQYLNKKYTGRA